MCKLAYDIVTSIPWIPPLGYLHANANSTFIPKVRLSVEKFLRKLLYCVC